MCVSENPWYATLYSSEAKLNSSLDGSEITFCENAGESQRSPFC